MVGIYIFPTIKNCNKTLNTKYDESLKHAELQLQYGPYVCWTEPKHSLKKLIVEYK